MQEPYNMAPRSAPFITLEGIDGAGKSTHIERLAERLRTQGHTVIRTREPGGTPLAEQLRHMVLHEPMDPLTEALLVFAARRDHIVRVIAPALARGDAVLCDRFADASFAYQGGGRGVAWERLEQLESWVLSDQSNTSPEFVVRPDCTVWFVLPPTVAAQRLSQARVADKFESESLGFFERVAAAYQRRAQEDPSRFVCVDANQTVEAVWANLETALIQRGVIRP